MKIILLQDEIDGHNSQVLGVGEALGLAFDVFYFGKGDSRFLKEADIIISAGSKMAKFAVKHKGRQTKLVHIMWPGFWLSRYFDLIAIPEHDGDRRKFPFSKAKIIKYFGAPNRVSKNILSQQKQIWQATFKQPQTPIYSIIYGDINLEQTKEMVKNIKKMLENGGSLMITNSRRSNDDNYQYLVNELKDYPNYMHNCKKSKRINPYYAFLAYADNIIVTADSISMFSEAMSSNFNNNKNIYIVASDYVKEKHKKFCQKAIKQGLAQKLESPNQEIIKQNIFKNPSQKIAQEIKRKIIV